MKEIVSIEQNSDGVWVVTYSDGTTNLDAASDPAPTPEPEPEPEPEVSQWEKNKDYIISRVDAGTATESQQAWYDRWVYSGSPEDKSGMVTVDAYEEVLAEEAAAEAEEAAALEAAEQDEAAAQAEADAAAQAEAEAAAAEAEAQAALDTWTKNKDYIVSNVEAGTADSSQQAWYDRWKASGSPEDKSGMMGINEYDAQVAAETQAAAEQAAAEEAAAAQAQAEEAAAALEEEAAQAAAEAAAQAEAEAQAQAEAEAQAQAEAEAQAQAEAEAQAQAEAEAQAQAEAEAAEAEPYIVSIEPGPDGVMVTTWSDGTTTKGGFLEDDLGAGGEDNDLGNESSSDHLDLSGGTTETDEEAAAEEPYIVSAEPGPDGYMVITWSDGTTTQGGYVDDGLGGGGDENDLGGDESAAGNGSSSDNLDLSGGSDDAVEEEAAAEEPYIVSMEPGPDGYMVITWSDGTTTRGGLVDDGLGAGGADNDLGGDDDQAAADAAAAAAAAAEQEAAEQAAAEAAAAAAAAEQEAAEQEAAEQAAAEQAAAEQAAAEAAAAAQAEADRQAYLASVNAAMQTGLYGSEGVDNTWGSGSTGGSGMFGQAYADTRQAATPPVFVDETPVSQSVVSTPYADAYIRAKQAAEQPNAVTSIFGDMF